MGMGINGQRHVVVLAYTLLRDTTQRFELLQKLAEHLL